MLTIRLLLVLCNIHNLEFKSIDFVLDFPQADLYIDICMDLPIGFLLTRFHKETVTCTFSNLIKVYMG